MRKIFVLFSILCACQLNAQTIDTTITSIVAVKLVPFKAQFSDSLNATHLGIRVVSDDLKSSAVLYWVIMLSNGTKSVDGNYTITGEEYEEWCNNSTPCNLWPFVVVKRKYSLTFKND